MTFLDLYEPARCMNEEHKHNSFNPHAMRRDHYWPHVGEMRRHQHKGVKYVLRAQLSGGAGLPARPAPGTVLCGEEPGRLSTDQTSVCLLECCICRFMKARHLQDIKTILRDNHGKGVSIFVSLPNPSLRAFIKFQKCGLRGNGLWSIAF